MYIFKRSVPAFLCLLLLAPLQSQAQIAEILNALGLGGAPAASPAEPDLSCAVRGADGQLACGGIGLEELLELCPELEGPDGTVLGENCEFVEVEDFALAEGKPMVLRGVNFEFDSARLTPQSRVILDQAVEVLEVRPSLLVSVDGHTDSKGHPDYNKQLSNERARAVHQYFVNKGIGEDRLAYRGFGQERPVEPNKLEDGSDNPAGRAENRRVELTVVNEDTFADIKQANREAERRRQAAPAPRPKPEPKREDPAPAQDEEPREEERLEERESEAPAFDDSEYMQFLQDSDIDREEVQEQPARPQPEQGDEDEFLDFLGEDELDSVDEGEGTAEREEREAADSDFDESEYLDFLRSLEDE